MQGMERKAYKYRSYPTDDQARGLAQTFGYVRYVYNGRPALRTEAWFGHHERIDDAETDRLLVRDPETSWLAEVSCVPLQQDLQHRNAAFIHFFAGRAQCPRFHRKHDRQSATYHIGGFPWKGSNLTLAQMNAPLDIRSTRPVGAEPTSVTVRKHQAGCSFVSFSTEEDVARLPEVNVNVGLDLGLLDTVVRSTGEKVGNEHFLRRDEKQLARAQRSPVRKQTRSRNRTKARCKVARIADRRRDFTHKRSTRIIRENQVVCAEGWNVKGVLAHPTLAKNIADVGWGALPRQLEYTARWYGRTFVPIHRFYPVRKRCHTFRQTVDHLPLAVRYWPCPICGAALDRDVNAAQNSKTRDSRNGPPGWRRRPVEGMIDPLGNGWRDPDEARSPDERSPGIPPA